MRKLLIGSLLVLSACSDTQDKASLSELKYTLTPRFSETENQLDVSVEFLGDLDGQTTIRVGARWQRDENAGKRFRDLSVSGEGVVLPAEINQPLLSINHAPGSELKISYTLSSKDSDNPFETVEYFYVPVLEQDVLHLIGSTSLIVPHWDDEDTMFDIDIDWTELPAGWNHIDTFPDRPVHPREIGSQILAAAPSDNISVIENGYQLTILKSGEHDFDADTFRNEIVKIYEGLNKLWKDEEQNFLITLLGTPDSASYSSFTGTGRFNSFASAASKGIDLDFLSQFLAHEIAHHWMPGRLGDWPTCPEGENCSPKISWFSEGFTDFVMAQAMMAEGRWKQADLITYTNQYLRNYYLSPAKTATAQEIDELFWEDYEYEKQPYWRGFLLAMNWDSELRFKNNGTSSVMDILQAMYNSARAVPNENRAVLNAEFIVQNFSSKADRDLFQDLEKFYYSGEVLAPNSNLFGHCALLKTESISSYDVGFDVEDTFSSGTISGVKPHHNSAKAGLKDGQIFVEKLSGGGGDTTVPLILEVTDNGKTRTISYLPVGGDTVQVPQFEMIKICKND